jgi:ribosomal protein S18 acetylase RimI-like enzyme
MKIRNYNKNDWEAVKEIYDLSRPDELAKVIDKNYIIKPLVEDKIQFRIFNDSEILVSEENNKVLGFIGYNNNHISLMYVHPAHRGKQIAKKLLLEVTENLEGIISLWVAEQNSIAVKFYKKMNFYVERKFQKQLGTNNVPVLQMHYKK